MGRSRTMDFARHSELLQCRTSVMRKLVAVLVAVIGLFCYIYSSIGSGGSDMVIIADMSAHEKQEFDQEALTFGSLQGVTQCASKTARGDRVWIDYEVTLSNGEHRYSSNRSKPLEKIIGDGPTLSKWDIGLMGMCVGSKRVVTVPSALALATSHMVEKDWDIPEGLFLHLEVTVTKVVETTSGNELFKLIDKDGDKNLSSNEMREYFEREHAVKSREWREFNPGPELLLEWTMSEHDSNGDKLISYEEYAVHGNHM